MVCIALGRTMVGEPRPRQGLIDRPIVVWALRSCSSSFARVFIVGEHRP